ncbi:hypothetical protein GYMLUDRAFT_905879 [Collybiopsis luxurians FD-317 M1]|uniref:Uncharacterized protein n=1 Tax=Collybiopsis luxurians FD-317 M1 TaxID=944289 RepID=A0A0D0BI59_9AGAR|nr:hypothetical protein GYMLUDRAFT_905879 [Collybiopsis luxurians FD-317 M1]
MKLPSMRAKQFKNLEYSALEHPCTSYCLIFRSVVKLNFDPSYEVDAKIRINAPIGNLLPTTTCQSRSLTNSLNLMDSLVVEPLECNSEYMKTSEGFKKNVSGYLKTCERYPASKATPLPATQEDREKCMTEVEKTMLQYENSTWLDELLVKNSALSYKRAFLVAHQSEDFLFC